MSFSDPIADMLLRIRNAYTAGLEVAEMPHSKLKGEIVRILKREGFISDFVVEGGDSKKTIRIYLKYTAKHEPAIRGMRRASKPGLRRYVTSREVPLVLGGLGLAVLSTSGGILAGKEARKRSLGGELLFTIW